MRALVFCLVNTVAVAALCAGEAQAEPIDDPLQDEIVVTGTRIPRKDRVSPSPVATFDRDEIGRQGATVLEDFLNDLPQVTPDFGKASNNPGDGTASIALRGLGRGRTLVLLNGRRLAPATTGSAVDVNSIPSAMIERIEIVSGGASAVYGSDAVAGAVDFITRSDFEGLELAVQVDIFGAGDGEVWNARARSRKVDTGFRKERATNMTLEQVLRLAFRGTCSSVAGGANFAEGRGHAAAFVDYLKRTPVFQGDREFSRTVLLGDGFGGLVASGSGFIPAGRTGGASRPPLFFNQDGTVRPFVQPDDNFNFAPANYLQAPLERWSAGVLADFDLSPAFKLYTELLYSRPNSQSELAPSPGFMFAAFNRRTLLRSLGLRHNRGAV